MKKILSIILAILMIATTIPFAFAADVVASGECGAVNPADVTWSLDSNGTLTISGTGKMDVSRADLPWEDYVKTIRNVVIEEGVTNITHEVFIWLENAESLSIPASVTEIETRYNNYFSKIILAEGNTTFAVVDNVLFTADKKTLLMYPGNSTNESYTVPDGVSCLGSFAFCSSEVKTVTLPDSVTHIENDCFHNSALKDINFSSNIEKIGYYAFAYTDLVTMVLPEKVTEIDVGLLFGCYDLETVVISSNVTAIDYNLLTYCDKVEAIHFTGTWAQWEAIIKTENAEDRVNTIPVHCGVEEKAETAATCVAGHTAGLYCTECEDYITGEVTPAEYDHSYTDGICSGCGYECPHADEDKNHKCDTCDATLSECADEDKNHKCDICGETLSECTDENRDYECDYGCGYEFENNCEHLCHKSGFMAFIWKIINFFSKLFKINPTCECGLAHY